MADPSESAELLAALQGVHKALEALSPEDRARVLRSVSALLEIPIIESVRPSSASTPQRNVEPVAVAPSGADRPLSLIELIQQKAPSTNAEYIALFAYYREKVEGVSRFARADLKEYFPKAKLAPPGNFDRDFGKALGAGWIHEDGNDSYLTTKGLEAVEFGFPSEARPGGSARRTTARKKSTARKRSTSRKKSTRR